MYPTAFLLSLACVFAAVVEAAPVSTQGVLPLSSLELSKLAPYTQFARATYCPGFRTWTCGAACKANGDFQLTLAGGDGFGIQQYFVGYSPSLRSIVVAHEGTDPVKLVSLLTDADILMDKLDPALFPGLPSSVSVHDGFGNVHSLTANKILREVKRLMTTKNTKNVALVGHSLGGALAELDALYLSLNIPSASIKAVTYGTPRVGNAEFVRFFNAKVPDFRRVNNKLDPVPIVPGRFLGFTHPHGEVHIISPGNAVSCPGNDDATDGQCQISSVPSILEGNILDHLGPYEGIHVGTLAC